MKVIAERNGVTVEQLALALVWRRAKTWSPFPGTKRRKYLEENLAAIAVKLSPAEVRELEAAVPPDAVAGGRYSDASLKTIDHS